MRVLQINSFCGAGSTGKIAADIYNVLKSQGHECKIAYGRGVSPDNIDAIKIGANIDNYLHVIKTRVFDNNGFGSAEATRAFIRQAENYNPDVIHLHNIHGYYINIEILFDYLKSAGKPVVWTLHDCWTFTGHCAYFDRAGCNKWKTGCSHCAQKTEYPKSLIMDRSEKNYLTKKKLFTSVENMTLVTPSRWLAGLAGGSFFKKYPVNIIPSGIDLDVFQPAQSDFRSRYNLKNKFIILGVASVWDKRKGLDYFVELSRRLEDTCRVAVVGVTEKQRSLLPENMLGILKTDSARDLANIYTAADVFVNPTLEEVQGLVNVEALACGTPAVTFDTGGSIECIDSQCGVAVPKGDVSALCGAVNEVKKNGKSFYSEACLSRARSLYNKNDRFADYVKLYDEVCGKEPNDQLTQKA